MKILTISLTEAQKRNVRRDRVIFREAQKKVAIFTNNNRMEVLKMILHSEKGLTTTDLYVSLRIEQSVASHIVGDLQDCGLIIDKRNGKEIIHRIDRERYGEIKKMAKLIAKF